MSPRQLNPKYCVDKSVGVAYVRLNGRKVFLGKAGSPESREKYHHLLAEWHASAESPRPRKAPDPAGPLSREELLARDERDDPKTMTLTELIARWRRSVAADVTEGKRPRGELGIQFDVLFELRRAFPDQTPAAKFGPLMLKEFAALLAGWRRYQDKDGQTITRALLSRATINAQVRRVKKLFRWAVENEVLPGSALHALESVKNLKFGKQGDKVQAVPDPTVQATLVHLNPHVQAMVLVQRLTGMRPGELCSMRRCDVDTEGKLWRYVPKTHKTQHKGKTRVVGIGPRAQEILKRFPARTEDPAEHFFRPIDAEEEQQRTAPADYGNGRGTKVAPGRKPGTRYTVEAYRRAIQQACEIAFGMPAAIHRARGDTPEVRKNKQTARSIWRRRHVWHPHQLRHSFGTEARREGGLEAAQVLLGHSSKSVTELFYADPYERAGDHVLLKIG